jgi:hypothetical protein
LSAVAGESALTGNLEQANELLDQIEEAQKRDSALRDLSWDLMRTGQWEKAILQAAKISEGFFTASPPLTESWKWIPTPR